MRSHLFDNPWSAYFIDSLIDLEETVSTLLWCGLKGHAYIDIVSAMGKLALEQICELVNADTPARDLLIKERRCSNRRRNKLTPGLGVRNRKQIVSHRRYEDDIPRSVFKLSRFGAKPLLDELGSDPQLRSGCLQWGVRCIWPSPVGSFREWRLGDQTSGVMLQQVRDRRQSLAFAAVRR